MNRTLLEQHSGEDKKRNKQTNIWCRVVVSARMKKSGQRRVNTVKIWYNDAMLGDIYIV